MHRTIGYLSKRFVQIRPGEGRKVCLTFLYFFLIISAYYIIKPVSRSLVLGQLGSRMVPYVDLISAVLMGPVVTLFAHLVDRLPKPRLVTLWFWAVIGILCVFWVLLRWSAAWVAAAFSVWVAIFSVLVVTLFWLVANDLYRPREAKRLFGFIGAGGILGGIVGSSIAAVGAQLIGTTHLLLLSAGLLVVCWMVVQRLWRFAPSIIADEEAKHSPSHRETFLSDLRGFTKLLLQSRYLLLLVAMVGLNKLIATLLYYQFNPFIERTFLSQDAKTTFTGLFFGAVNVAAFIIQFFFTSGILRRLGLAAALVALPLGDLIGTAGLLLLPVFWIAATTELYDGSLNYSLQQTTKEVLYLPIDRSIRYKVKPFIDMVVFRFGKGVAAIIGIILLDAMRLPPRFLSCVAIPFLVVWLIVVVRLRREYVATVRTMLQARALRRATPEAAMKARFGSLVERPSLERKLALIHQLLSAAKTPHTHANELIAQLGAHETPPEISSETLMDALELKAIIANPRELIASRCHAIRLLVALKDQAAVDCLLEVVAIEEDAILRQELVLGLLRLRLSGAYLDFPAKAVRRQIAHEVANYQRIAHVASLCRRHHRGTLSSDGAIMKLLSALLEESTDQIFRLLMLLYRPDDIHLVYEQLRETDAYVRADAIELLDNLVDPEMRSIIFPILDEDRFLDRPADEWTNMSEPTIDYRILQEAIWDHNQWLSVATLCAIGQMRLSAVRQELERASREGAPPLATAAKVAIHIFTCA
jgi:AAA family ATP:ADP antiporter